MVGSRAGECLWLLPLLSVVLNIKGCRAVAGLGIEVRRFGMSFAPLIPWVLASAECLWSCVYRKPVDREKGASGCTQREVYRGLCYCEYPMFTFSVLLKIAKPNLNV